jgi:hypothetical protein
MASARGLGGWVARGDHRRISWRRRRRQPESRSKPRLKGKVHLMGDKSPKQKNKQQQQKTTEKNSKEAKRKASAPTSGATAPAKGKK